MATKKPPKTIAIQWAVGYHEAFNKFQAAKKVILDNGRTQAAYESNPALGIAAWAKDISALSVAIANLRAWEKKIESPYEPTTWATHDAKHVQEAILYVCVLWRLDQQERQKTPVLLWVKEGSKKKRLVVQTSDLTDEDVLNEEIVDAMIAAKMLEEPYRRDYVVSWRSREDGSIRLFEPDRENPPILSFFIC